MWKVLICDSDLSFSEELKRKSLAIAEEGVQGVKSVSYTHLTDWLFDGESGARCRDLFFLFCLFSSVTPMV